MDAANLNGQVDDLVTALTSPQQHAQNNAVRKYFAPDAVLETPVTTVKGIKDIKELAELHAAFQKNNKLQVSKVEWDNENKTASFSVKAKYGLPLANAPWPWSLGRHFWVTIPSDVKLYVSPDDSYPVQSDSTEATKYNVSKVVTRVATPRNSLVAAAYGAIIFVVRIVAPYVISILIVVNKFFQRNPLENGYLRTGFAAVHDLVFWVLNFIRTQIPFITAKNGKKRQGDEPGLGYSTTVQDTGRQIEASVDKLTTAVKESKPVKEAVRFAQSSTKAVQDGVKAAQESKPVKDAVRFAQDGVKAAKESEPVQEVTKAVEKTAKAVQESQPVKEAKKLVDEGAKAAEEHAKEVQKEAKKLVDEGAKAAEEKAKEVQKGAKVAEEKVKAVEEKAKAVKEEAEAAVKEEVKESKPKEEHKAHKESKEHKQHHHKEHKQHSEPKPAHSQPKAPETIPLKKVEPAVAEAVKEHEAPAPVIVHAPEHDQQHPSFADIASHQPANHASDETTNSEAFPSLAEATGHGHENAPSPAPVPIETSPEHPSFADVAAESPETPSGSSTSEEKPKTAQKKKKSKKNRK